jgi:anti-sigma regulatory factor (Ser/Thr protein kinase)
MWYRQRNTQITIPDNLPDVSIGNFFTGWYWIDRPDGAVTLDFRNANFISPWAITVFATYALWLRVARGKKVRVLLNDHSIAGDYMCRVGFLELLGIAAPPCSKDGADRMTELTRIQSSSEIPQFTNRVMELLDIGDPEIEGAVKYSLVELLRNVVQHSQSSIGGVAMAQYYPKTGLVELVVGDAGVGIRKTLEAKYPEINNSYKALKFAVQPHVSGTFAPGAYAAMHENAGLGLFFIRQIASLSGGSIQLASGSCLTDIWGDNEGRQQRRVYGAARGGWPGTFAVLQLKKDSIADFDGVLHVCRQLAEAARKDPRELWLDFLDEVPDIEGLVVVRVAEFEENVEEATRVREEVMGPALRAGQLAILDFEGIPFVTQSFIHALMYKILREDHSFAAGLSIANCSKSTREAILVVAGYATIPESEVPEGWKM